MQDKPLEGIKILELSSIVTASLATMILCDQGSEVIKVEPTGLGDSMRYLGTQKGGFSAIFANCNRGKQSLNLNLKDKNELKVLLKLVEEADVFISNFRLGVNEKLGLGREALIKINPNLIYVSITGFGEEGPLSSAPAYDHVIQGMSGATSIQSSDDQPAYIKTLIFDKITAYTACQALTAALYKREKVNPMSGCLPILPMIFVFFALYKVLFVTLDGRHKPFYGWIKDLSERDPTSIFNLFGLIPWDPPSFLMIGALPCLMGITMYLQQKLNPTPPDPVQAKIFMFFPLFLTVILAPFPSGLVIYWTINNVLTMAQQYVIMKKPTLKTV